MRKPKPFTIPEMREMFVNHLHALAKYWAKTDLKRPEFEKVLAEKGETLYRLEGLLFSFLVTLDGGSGGMPAFDITPAVSAEDKKYFQDEGEQWWDTVVINECQLHDIFSARE